MLLKRTETALFCVLEAKRYKDTTQQKNAQI